MLGFDAYTKSTFGAIIEQRIRLFLVKRKVVNFILTEVYDQVIGPETKAKITEQFFGYFVGDLRAAGLYEEYAVVSILLEESDYDFVSNDAATTIQKAYNTLQSTFEKICNKVMWPADKKKEDKTGSTVFDFLRNDPKLHREIPYYGPHFVGDNYPDGADWLYTSSDTTKFIDLAGPFYLEFFWRLKKASAKNVKELGGEDDWPDRYNYFSHSDRIIADKTELYPRDDLGGATGFNANFVRGVRLMFNMTSAIEEFGLQDPTVAGRPYSKYGWGMGPYYPLMPSQFLPFFYGTDDEESSARPDVDPAFTGGSNGAQLPFLTSFDNTVYTNYPGAKPKKWDKANPGNAVYNLRYPIFEAVKKIKMAILGNNSWKKESKKLRHKDGNYFGDKISDKPNEHNFYKEMIKNNSPTNAAGPIATNWFRLKWSKSLITFEANSPPNKTNHTVSLQFPIMLAEFVDEDDVHLEKNGKHHNPPKYKDEDLIDELLKTKNVKFLESALKPPDIISEIEINEENLKVLEKNEDSLEIKIWGLFPEDLATTPPIKGFVEDLPPVLFQTKDAEKGLDNMLVNLINFDEE